MPLTPAELVKADHEHLIHPLHHPTDHAEPMIYVKGKGATITDATGREYLDGLAGLWNVNVGHGRAELAEAAAAQIRDLAYFSAYTGSSNVPAITLASKLVDLSNNVFAAVFFTSGGAESNESAFKTARFYWKAQGKPEKTKVIARINAYHGVTLQAMSATGMGAYWKMFEPRVPGFAHIPMCYPYRQVDQKPGETAGRTAARLLDEAIVREGADTVAAFIAEPIAGAGGVLYPDDDYFTNVRAVCDKHQVLFIADEVITGFCRTGRWFAMPHWNVRPDIMSFAKGVTSGYLPLGGIMVSKAIKDVMDNVKPEDRWMHAYTYSGHPTCCAVGLRNIAIMEQERLWENSAKMGDRLFSGLKSAFGDHPNAGDIRGGKGLLAAVEFVEDKATKANFAGDKKVANRLMAEMAKRGVMTRVRASAGPHPNVGDSLYFSPPLMVNEADVDRLVSVARDAAKTVFGA
jgi:adenosylmethionine-8-amino-7-oxononanoate aminotransferase